MKHAFKQMYHKHFAHLKMLIKGNRTPKIMHTYRQLCDAVSLNPQNIALYLTQDIQSTFKETKSATMNIFQFFLFSS